MKLGNIRELGARLEARFPFMWESRYRLAAFILLFLVFFVVNQQLLKLPETLRRMLNAFPMGHIAYSDVAIHIFPPEVEIKDATLVDRVRYDVVLRFDTLTIRPELWQFFSGKAALRVTAQAGSGLATLDATTDSSFDFSNTSFTLNMENMPLRTLGLLEQFDPDIDGAISAQVKGKVGLPISRQCDLAANGRITLASARNDLPVLTFGRFRNGVFLFDLGVADSTASVRRMDFTDDSCSAALSGKILINWRDAAASTLDLKGEVTTRPEHVTPVLLMDDMVRRRLEQGQPLPITVKGTLGDVQMKPVF